MLINMGRLPWTHYHLDPDTGRITLFKLDRCETCGHYIQAPNSVGTTESPAKLERMGVKRLGVLPPEGWYNDETDMEACDFCGGNVEGVN